MKRYRESAIATQVAPAGEPCVAESCVGRLTPAPGRRNLRLSRLPSLHHDVEMELKEKPVRGLSGPIPALPRSGIWKRTSPIALILADREAADSRFAFRNGATHVHKPEDLPRPEDPVSSA
jgi:hypothetical protein